MPLNLPIFLLALATVETGCRDGAVGAHGEKGRYAITERVWRTHTKLPFGRAREHVFSRACAVQHVAWLQCRLPAGSREDPAAVAAAWNGGLKGMARERPRDFGRRVANLYHEELRLRNAQKPDQERFLLVGSTNTAGTKQNSP